MERDSTGATPARQTEITQKGLATVRSAVGSPRYTSPRPPTIASLAGKYAMLVVTTGGWEPHYRPCGINGPIDEILFPIQHGFLHYPVFDVVPPFVSYRTGRMDETRFARIMQMLVERLNTSFTTTPIPFRRQNAGNYDILTFTLRDGIAPGKSGFATHLV